MSGKYTCQHGFMQIRTLCNCVPNFLKFGHSPGNWGFWQFGRFIQNSMLRIVFRTFSCTRDHLASSLGFSELGFPGGMVNPKTPDPDPESRNPYPGIPGDPRMGPPQSRDPKSRRAARFSGTPSRGGYPPFWGFGGFWGFWTFKTLFEGFKIPDLLLNQPLLLFGDAPEQMHRRTVTQK